jgi:hypothetical protein
VAAGYPLTGRRHSVSTVRSLAPCRSAVAGCCQFAGGDIQRQSFRLTHQIGCHGQAVLLDIAADVSGIVPLI